MSGKIAFQFQYYFIKQILNNKNKTCSNKATGYKLLENKIAIKNKI